MYSLPAAHLLAAALVLAPVAPKQESSPTARPSLPAAQPAPVPAVADPGPDPGSSAVPNPPVPERDPQLAAQPPEPSGEAAPSADPIAPAMPEAPARQVVCDALGKSASDHRIPRAFFARLIWQESRFNPQAVSPAGARGIAQFMPATARQRGLEDPFDPGEAIRKSAELLGDLAKQFGNVGLAAAAYNAGPNRTKAWLAGRKPLPAETKTYVRKITGHSPEEWNGTKSWQPPRRVAAPCEQMAEADAVPATDGPELSRANRACCNFARLQLVARTHGFHTGPRRGRDHRASSSSPPHSRSKPQHPHHHEV
jgi:Transglycosylase SLT domain